MIKLLAKRFVAILFTLLRFRHSSPLPATLASDSVEELLKPLDSEFRSALLSMYQGEPQLGVDGQLHPINKNTKISPHEGMWLYNLCVSIKPEATLEIGMAYGFSTLYFIAAIARNQTGHHTAIDPFQRSHWKGIGLTHANAHRSTLSHESAFHFIEERSVNAATDLVRSNVKFDLIFIDGAHRFDDVLVDFYLYAPLCADGGLIVFDDTWMSSIRTVVSFIRANRADFSELSTPIYNVSVFQRVGADLRDWNHFLQFTVAHDSGEKK